MEKQSVRVYAYTNINYTARRFSGNNHNYSIYKK